MTPPGRRNRGSETPDPSPSERRDSPVDDDRPPIFGTWPRLYAAVLVNLVLLVTLFYLFARAFR